MNVQIYFDSKLKQVNYELLTFYANLHSHYKLLLFAFLRLFQNYFASPTLLFTYVILAFLWRLSGLTMTRLNYWLNDSLNVCFIACYTRSLQILILSSCCTDFKLCLFFFACTEYVESMLLRTFKIALLVSKKRNKILNENVKWPVVIRVEFLRIFLIYQSNLSLHPHNIHFAMSVWSTKALTKRTENLLVNFLALLLAMMN